MTLLKQNINPVTERRSLGYVSLERVPLLNPPFDGKKVVDRRTLVKLTTSVLVILLCLSAGGWVLGQENAVFSATVPNPAGSSSMLHVELVQVKIPDGKTGSISFLEEKPFYEQAMIVHEGTPGTSLAEYMRWGTERHNRHNLDRSLMGGKTYVFAAWHIGGPANSFDRSGNRIPWAPSHCRLIRTENGYRVESDDGDAGTSKGDHDFKDIVANIVIK